MRIFTIEFGKVVEGVRVDSFKLEGAGMVIPAILIGEQGRGRQLGVIPVELLPSFREEWEENGCVHIHSATLGTTKAGKPKLFQNKDEDTTKCIAVLRTHIGFRGSNSHTGDRVVDYWVLSPVYWVTARRACIPVKDRYTTNEVREYSPALMETFARRIGAPHGKPLCEDTLEDTLFEQRIQFAPFPGQVICRGRIAQGDAGNMGAGDQLVAVMPENIVFRTGYKGRLYGAPKAHYYVYKNGKLLSATWAERELTGVF